MPQSDSPQAHHFKARHTTYPSSAKGIVRAHWRQYFQQEYFSSTTSSAHSQEAYVSAVCIHVDGCSEIKRCAHVCVQEGAASLHGWQAITQLTSPFYSQRQTAFQKRFVQDLPWNRSKVAAKSPTQLKTIMLFPAGVFIQKCINDGVYGSHLFSSIHSFTFFTSGLTIQQSLR